MNTEKFLKKVNEILEKHNLLGPEQSISQQGQRNWTAQQRKEIVYFLVDGTDHDLRVTTEKPGTVSSIEIGRPLPAR